MNPAIGLEPGVTKLYDHAIQREGLLESEVEGGRALVKWDDIGTVSMFSTEIEGFARAYDDWHQLAKLTEFSAEIESLTVGGWENAGDVLRQVRHAVLKLKGEKIWT